MESEPRENAGPSSRVVRLAVSGMHCASCVSTIERALQRLEGVESATVNLATGRARVSAGPEVETSRLVSAVAQAGYEAEALDGAAPSESRRRAAPAGATTIETIVGVVLGGAAMAIHLAGGAAHAHVGPLHFVQGGLAAIALAWPGRRMIAAAARSARAGSPNMDVLVSLGALASFIAGLAGLLTANPRLVLFDAAAMIVGFVTLGKWLEQRARRRAGAALTSLSSRIPAEAVVLRDGRAVTVPIGEVGPGTQLELAADRYVAVDAEIREGTVTVDEAIVTGESLPVTRATGDRVLGGTMVVEGRAVAVATASGEESTAAQIARIVEEAQAKKPRWQRLADRVAAWFVPAILALATMTVAGWWLGSGDFIQALERGVAVVVIACPCALGLAIPTAVLVGTGRAAEAGVLVRDPEALETAAKVRTILLDKTGTVTLGRPIVSDVVAADGVAVEEVLAVAAALERASQHPLARAIVAHAEKQGVGERAAEDIESVVGRGVRGRVDGATALVGSGAWLESRGLASAALSGRADALAAEGASVAWVATGGRVLGLVALTDELHPESRQALAQLREAGISLRLLSGDRIPAVRAVAERLGGVEFDAELSPAAKLDAVRAAVQRGGGAVAMVGDGVNDAPALAAANVGIAMGGGADVAREAGDICLVAQSPRLILRAIELSRASTRIMKQNIGWAVGYNVLMLPLAAGTGISPAWAAAAMMFSSLSVVLNALRLRWA